MIMAGMIPPEPLTMTIARTPDELRSQSHSKNEKGIDYRKIPRSSGDGMEHNGSGTEQNYPKNIQPTHIQSLHDKMKDGVQIFATRQGEKQKERIISNQSKVPEGQKSDTNYPRKTVHKIENDYKHFQEIHKRKDLPDISSLASDGEKQLLSIDIEQQKEIDAQDSDIQLMLSDLDYPGPDNETFNTITDEYKEEMEDDRDRRYLYAEMQRMIKDLEERNAKLVEEKTKLCVQLGLQTQVNSEVKKLLVAAVGDDLDNSLEAILMKNAQSVVEIRHWKTLSEEYAEESDKLAIECDVWRTKFMANRMMSDELTSWRTTLYTKYKQTKNALQRILNERAELKKHLVTTKRLLHSLGFLVKSHTSSYQSTELLNEGHSTHQQSVLELASILSCLVHDLAVQVQNMFSSSSIPAEVLSLTEEAEKQTVEPSPAEKLAIQVFSSDVELHTEEQQEESTVMKRMGKQYIGNSYHSRLMTNSFRVTFDCCNRCKGPIVVV